MRLSLSAAVALSLLAFAASAAGPDYKKLHALQGAKDNAQLEAALKAPYLADLQAFVKAEHSGENLEFILAAAKGDKKAIYEKYVKSGAPREINLPSAVKTKLDTLAKEKGGFAKMNFADAIHEIKRLMTADTMVRFMAAHKVAAAPALSAAAVAAIVKFKTAAETAKSAAEGALAKGKPATTEARNGLATRLTGNLSKAKEAKLAVKDAAAKASADYKAADAILGEATTKVAEARKMIGGK